VKVQFEVIGPVKAAALLCSLEPAASVPPDQERRVKVELPDVGEPPPVETLLAHLEAENMQKEIDGKENSVLRSRDILVQIRQGAYEEEKR
jgi:hypothetical protein